MEVEQLKSTSSSSASDLEEVTEERRPRAEKVPGSWWFFFSVSPVSQVGRWGHKSAAMGASSVAGLR